MNQNLEKVFFVPADVQLHSDPKHPGIIRYTGNLRPFATPQTPWLVKFSLAFSIFSVLFNTYVLWRRMCGG